MPKMSGRTLAERLAEMKPGLAVLYMSGNISALPSRTRNDRIASIQKPFNSQTLLEAVHDVLSPGPAASSGER
jgi:FixJ family two-component response regulator